MRILLTRIQVEVGVEVEDRQPRILKRMALRPSVKTATHASGPLCATNLSRDPLQFSHRENCHSANGCDTRSAIGLQAAGHDGDFYNVPAKMYLAFWKCTSN